MIISKIEKDYIEVIAIDKTKDKLHQLFHNYNYYLNCNNPKETVIFEDSYAQLNTKLTIDNIEELKYFRKTLDKLSNKKLQKLLKKYEEYHNSNVLDEKRIVHMNKEEILKLNEEILIKS